MTVQPFRLFAGGRIERDRAIEFQFDGRRLAGYPGDTLASALLANGVHLVGRSFKYHRPRGIFSAGAEEPNALVQVGRRGYSTPNLRATQVELYPGLEAESQNRWPSLAVDVGEVNDLAARLIPAGFYYKTFMWPRDGWMRYEHFIRRAAGLGRAPSAPDPDRYDKMHAHCDVLVVGAGPAGLSAALAAGRAGARVIVADEQSELGGSLLGTRARIDDGPAADWAQAARDELESMPDVVCLARCTVTGYYDHNYLTAVERVADHLPPGSRPGSVRQRLWKIRARQVVLATGAHERPLVFSDNDRPGVMLADAARTYVNRYAVRPGERAVFLANNDGAYEAAVDVSDAGVAVTVVDLRAAPAAGCRAEAERRGIEVITGHGITHVHGRLRVRAVDVAALSEDRRRFIGPSRRMRADVVAMSGGWNPVVHLFSQSRGRLAFDPNRACYVPGESFQAERSAGAANGTFDLAFCFTEGAQAGKAAAADTGHRRRGAARAVRVEARDVGTLEPCWSLPPRADRAPRNKHFVDFQNDVTAADIALASREGYRSVEHVKRYTTTGMGTDQGKTSNVNAIGILAAELGTDPPSIGTTTFRPPYTPVTFGALAGRDIGALADPVRTTPIHPWHQANGALFEDVGQWKRPWYYPRAGESMSDALARECRAAREAVAILDASTLGRIDVRGPDAPEFLDRIYTNGWKKLGIGRARYGLMCTEDGMVFDDGVTVRLAEDRYLVHTTSGNAARVLAWMEEWLQTEWPDLRVYLNSVTEQWATASISGPYARALLARLTEGVDLSPGAFPFMSMREAVVAGIDARVARVSFTGESTFEVSVPSDHGLWLWNAMMHAGAAFGITPFGTESMHILRAEKGFIIAGQETDGTVTPIDLGLESMVAKHKDFIGKRSLARSDTRRDDRKQLVGLLTENPDEVLPEGAQVTLEAHGPVPRRMVGHVTSSYYSASLGRSIALALLRGGRARHGETVFCPLERKTVGAVVSEPVFYDPDGERMRG